MLPIPVLDASQAAAWDERARAEARIPSRVLMETAGRAVAQLVARRFPDALRNGVLIAAGHGNNGGDGWVAARALARAGASVFVAETERERSADCRANRELALAEGVEVLDAGAMWPGTGVVIDALLGTGASGAPRGDIGELASRVAAHAGPVVAVDGPTGLDLTTGEPHGPVRATLAVTFGGARRGHLLGREWCGRVVVTDIGFPPPDAGWPLLFTDDDATRLLPALRADMHKGSRGRVLVVGGAQGMAGAALHAASAAFGVGAGLVKLVASQAAVEAAQSQLHDALSLTSALGPEPESDVAEALAWADAIVLGPGIGRGDDRAKFITAILARATVPLVIDADALHVGPDALRSGTAARVFTPHAGEFRWAFPQAVERAGDDRFASADLASQGLPDNAAVLLKGVPTVVAAPRRAQWIVAAGNPGLATGGSGDLLAGFIASYLARGLAPADAAALGAWTLGRAADLAAAHHTARATRPGDVLASLPELWRQLSEPRTVVPPVLVDLPPPIVV